MVEKYKICQCRCMQCASKDLSYRYWIAERAGDRHFYGNFKDAINAVARSARREYNSAKR